MTNICAQTVDVVPFMLVFEDSYSNEAVEMKLKTIIKRYPEK